MSNFRNSGWVFVWAVAGPPAIAAAVAASPDAHRSVAMVAGEAALLLLVVAVGWHALRVEGMKPGQLGLVAIGWRTLLMAVTLGVFLRLAFAPVAYWLLARLGTPQIHAAVSDIGLPWRLLVIAIGGCAEEFLYRGYALTRLVEWTQRPVLALTLSSVIFGAAHGPGWGVGLACTTALAGLVFGACFLWRRDLPALAAADVVTDLAGLA